MDNNDPENNNIEEEEEDEDFPDYANEENKEINEKVTRWLNTLD